MRYLDKVNEDHEGQRYWINRLDPSKCNKKNILPTATSCSGGMYASKQSVIANLLETKLCLIVA